MASTIGIKIANGEFYSLLDENSSAKKKLILTTVHDNQPGMQIDLYRSVAKVMNDAQYIGSLVVENIKSGPKGEPSIQMIISSNSEGDITAEVLDLDKGSGLEPNVLSVSLKTLDGADRNLGVQDFELENKEGSSSGLYEHAKKIREKKKRKAPLVIICLILILGLLAAWFFFYGGRDIILREFNRIRAVVAEQIESKLNKPEPAKPEPVKVEPAKPEPEKKIEPVKQEEPPPPEPAPVIVAPKEPPAPKPVVTRVRPPAPVSSYKVPAVIPKDGAPYKIRWGDTLWDIAEAFYRNPWLYQRIARFNNIRNPDLIISGRTIRIPPKN